MANKAVIRKWVDALRSGEYTQGKGALAVIQSDGSTSYCCLGVLCDLASKEGIVESLRNIDYIAYQDKVRSAPPCSGLLPDGVYQWAMEKEPISTHEWVGDVSLNARGETHRASYLNDSGESFSQIADLIESTYLQENA